MSYLHSRAYQRFAPMIGRIFVALPFLVGAFYKIPGSESFAMQAGMTGNVGVPFPTIAVFLAFILEVVGGVALLTGIHVRIASAVLALFVMLLTVLFHWHFATPMDIGTFINHLVLIGALLTLSVHGGKKVSD